jgi:hypothetical protein
MRDIRSTRNLSDNTWIRCEGHMRSLKIIVLIIQSSVDSSKAMINYKELTQNCMHEYTKSNTTHMENPSGQIRVFLNAPCWYSNSNFFFFFFQTSIKSNSIYTGRQDKRDTYSIFLFAPHLKGFFRWQKGKNDPRYVQFKYAS